MSKHLDWRSYMDQHGNFEMPNFLYRSNNELMKQCLDFGTMITDDKIRLRAYKEQVKKAFRARWFSIADALEQFDIIESCVCREGDYCEICGGSRFRLSEWLTPDEMHHIAAFTATVSNFDLETMLQEGLQKAIYEVSNAVPAVRQF